MIKKGENGEYIVGKHTGISLSVVFVLLTLLAASQAWANQQTQEMQECKHRISFIESTYENDNPVTHNEYDIFKENIQGDISEIKEDVSYIRRKLDNL